MWSAASRRKPPADWYTYRYHAPEESWPDIVVLGGPCIAAALLIGAGWRRLGFALALGDVSALGALFALLLPLAFLSGGLKDSGANYTLIEAILRLLLLAGGFAAVADAGMALEWQWKRSMQAAAIAAIPLASAELAFRAAGVTRNVLANPETAKWVRPLAEAFDATIRNARINGYGWDP